MQFRAPWSFSWTNGSSPFRLFFGSFSAHPPPILSQGSAPFRLLFGSFSAPFRLLSAPFRLLFGSFSAHFPFQPLFGSFSAPFRLIFGSFSAPFRLLFGSFSAPCESLPNPEEDKWAPWLTMILPETVSKRLCFERGLDSRKHEFP